MTNQTTDPAPDRPLVTFALFAYNQEHYIREAVEGAFAQTYQPLEIILSDDCSSDRTYQIMQEMAAAYEGPHEVRVRRNEVNLGLADHINKVASTAKGGIVVMAAGDDVSMPIRTQRISEAFIKNRDVSAVLSDYETIPCGQARKKFTTPERISLLQIIIAGGGVQKGATYAYRKSSFCWPRTLPNSIISEDRILPFRSAILGYVYYIDEALIKYRTIDPGLALPKINDRPVWYNHPTHVREIMFELRKARAESKINLIQYSILSASLRQSQTAALLKSKTTLPNIVGWMVFLPLRIVRRFDSGFHKVITWARALK